MKILLILIAILFPVSVWAEAVALGGGDSKEKKPLPPPPKPPEWVVLEADLQSLTMKIKQKQAGIDKLIQEKRSTEDRMRISEIIKELNREQKVLSNHVSEYDQQRTILRYRYPERKSSSYRKYEKIEVKAIEDIESQSVLGKALSKTLTLVQKVYNQQKSSSPKVEGDRNPASLVGDSQSDAVPEKNSKSIRLIDETPLLRK